MQLLPKRWSIDRWPMRLIVSLKGAMPSARGWPVIEKARYFHNFLFGLWPPDRDAIHVAVRDELVRRLLALPEERIVRPKQRCGTATRRYAHYLFLVSMRQKPCPNGSLQKATEGRP